MTELSLDRSAEPPPDTLDAPPSRESARARLVGDLALLVIRQFRREQRGAVGSPATRDEAGPQAK